jgi:hypothetical protein
MIRGGYPDGMSRASLLLSSLTDTPTSTEDLYDRVGYATLTQLGLVPYDAFRQELVRLSAQGLAASESGPDGATLWRRADPDAEGAAP